MKRLSLWTVSVLLGALISCKESEKEQQKLDDQLEKIESVEKEIDETVKEVKRKAADVEAALEELDSI